MSVRRSIPTRYRDILFRSKLEADWARTFDGLGLEWEYEPEGMYLGNLFYLPDFWLPAAKQYVEVKGVMDEMSLRKAVLLALEVDRPRPNPLVVRVAFALPGLRFTGLFVTPPGQRLQDVVADMGTTISRCGSCGVAAFYRDQTGCVACGRHVQTLHRGSVERGAA